MPILTLKERFKYQPPTPDQLPRYEKIRKGALKLARIIEETTPDNVGREAAICALEMVVMTANKAIALERFKRV